MASAAIVTAMSVAAKAQRTTDEALNPRAAGTPGLLQRLEMPLVEAVEAIGGALQAQHWLLARRIALLARGGRAATQAPVHGELVTGTLLRATLHLVSAREHPAYAAVVKAAGTDDWRRTKAQPPEAADELLAQLSVYAGEAPRSGAEIAAFIEDWVQAHPDALDAAEVAEQRSTAGGRSYARPHSCARRPTDAGQQGPGGPQRCAHGRRSSERRRGAARGDSLRHLRAFGPAGAEDVAVLDRWRVPPVRDALAELAPDLISLQDASGRPLFDIPDAPRPMRRRPRRRACWPHSTACCWPTRASAASGSCPTCTATRSTSAPTCASSRASGSTPSRPAYGRSRSSAAKRR